MILNANTLVKSGLQVVSKNGPAILTAFGAVGTITTAVLAAKASFEAAERIQKETLERNVDVDDEDGIVFLTKTEKAKLVWPLYIGAISSGAFTCGAIIMAHRISARRAAVLAAAYALNEGKLEEYQQKIKEKFGIKEEKEARDELAQDRINRDHAGGTLIFNPLEGKHLMKDDYSGRYFYSTIEEVNRAVNEINAVILREDTATVSEFYDMLGLEHVSTSDFFGWNTNERLEVDWSTCTTPDKSQAVHVFEFVNPPIMNPGSRQSFR